MIENNYAFAVAQVRSLENYLFNKAAYEQVLLSNSDREIFDALLSHGYKAAEDDTRAEDVLNGAAKQAYELLEGLMKGAVELKLFTVKNDFHNLKTVIKGLAGETAFEENLMAPYSVDPGIIKEAVSEKKYDLLPSVMEKASKESVEALGVSLDGQIADAVVDKYTLLAYREIADQSDSAMVKEYVDTLVTAADIKTAYRGALTHRSEEFYNNALCGSFALSSAALTRAARKGEEDVISLVSSLGFAEEAAALKVSLFEFEKMTDKKLLQITDKAVFENFSVDPLVAYGIKRENEIKNLRICIAGIRTGNTDTVTERMCLPDV